MGKGVRILINAVAKVSILVKARLSHSLHAHAPALALA